MIVHLFVLGSVFFLIALGALNSFFSPCFVSRTARQTSVLSVCHLGELIFYWSSFYSALSLYFYEGVTSLGASEVWGNVQAEDEMVSLSFHPSHLTSRKEPISKAQGEPLTQPNLRKTGHHIPKWVWLGVVQT